MFEMLQSTLLQNRHMSIMSKVLEKYPNFLNICWNYNSRPIVGKNCLYVGWPVSHKYPN